MQKSEIEQMQSWEEKYWWHVSRRLILQSVLNRFFSIVRHSGLACPATAGDPESRQKNKQENNSCFCLDSRLRGNDNRGGNCKNSKINDRNRKILDVGCGTGINFAWLQDFGDVTGVDSSEAAVELANSTINYISSSLVEGPRFIPRAQSRGYIQNQAKLGRAEDLPVEDQEFNLVTAFDVLEHLSDEKRALGEWGRVLKSGGYLFISVPAYQWLFGPHDRALSHCRRYNLSGLVKLLEDNGFQTLFSSYIFCLTFPAFLLQRWLAKFSHRESQQYIAVPPWLNNILIGLGKTEASWLRFIRFPFGSSIVAVAQKNE